MKTKLKVFVDEQALNSVQVIRDAMFSYASKSYCIFFLKNLFLKIFNSSKWVNTGQRFSSSQK